MSGYQEIKLARILPNPQNPRKRFDGLKFEELVASVTAKGVIEPIIVRPIDGNGDHPIGTFEIVAGERRFKASQKAGKETIPAMVRTLSDEETFEFMTIENLQREDLTEREEADSFRAYLDHKGDEALPDLAERTGIDARYIRRRVRVLTLPAQVLEAWEKGKLAYGHLEQLRRLEDEKEVLHWFAEITRNNSWNRDETGSTPVAWLKRQIDDKAIPLKNGLFDKAECKTCSKNSAVQKQLFGLDGKTTLCLDGVCFKQKQNNFLMANWKKTTWAKKDKTNGFRFEGSLAYNERETMYRTSQKECRKCENFVSLIPLDGDEDHYSYPICIDVACFRKLFHSKTNMASGKTHKESRTQKHGEQFREAFYAVRIPAIVEDVIPSDDKIARLALVSMIHKDHDLVEWFAKANNSKKGKQVGYWYLSAPELWAVVEKMSQPDVMRFLKAAALRISMQPGYGAQGRHAVARHFGIDLARDWRITEQYLQAKTIKEILAIGKKLGFWEDKKTQGYLYEKMGKKRKAFETCKKSELIQVILKSGIDLAGKVPDEILKIDGLSTNRGKKSASPAKVRTCRVCGCTDQQGCDGGCCWVEEDLCSACE